MTTPNRITDDEILTAFEELYENPARRDGAEGGIHPSTLATEMEIDVTTATDRLRELADRGCVRQVDGVDPDTLRWRLSYTPADPRPAPSSTALSED